MTSTRTGLKWETNPPNPDSPAPKPAASAPDAEVDGDLRPPSRIARLQNAPGGRAPPRPGGTHPDEAGPDLRAGLRSEEFANRTAEANQAQAGSKSQARLSSGRAPAAIRDGWMRALGIPFFGLVIPRMTGLLGNLTPADALYWAGTAYFIGVAALIWQGNRWLLFKQRAHLDWFNRPVLKLVLLVAANIVYTAPVTIALCWAWLWFVGAPFVLLNWAMINLATSYVVIAVIFVTHAYETVFLIKERENDQLRLERVERARLEAELETMKAQLAPHFLFNCLNTLAALIERTPAQAAAFNQHLADVCRYLLLQKNRDLVPLDDELAFFDSYVSLTRLRFPKSVQVTLAGLDDPATRADLLIPPASLQLLLENAIKHNQFDEANPLPVEVRLDGDGVVVTNPLRAKRSALPSTGIGLHNLRERVQLVSGATLQTGSVEGNFRVRLPVVRMSHGK